MVVVGLPYHFCQVVFFWYTKFPFQLLPHFLFSLHLNGIARIQRLQILGARSILKITSLTTDKIQDALAILDPPQLHDLFRFVAFQKQLLEYARWATFSGNESAKVPWSAAIALSDAS